MKTRYIVIMGLILVLMIAAGGFIYLAHMDTSRIKTTIADQLEDAIGKKVTIAGDAEIKLKLPLTVSMYDLRIQNASWSSDPQMAQIQQLAVKMSLLSLLFGNISIYDLKLTGADFFIEISKTGEWNFVSLSEKASVSRPSMIDRIRIENSRINYRHGRNEKRYQINISALTVNSGKHDGLIKFVTRSVYKNLSFSVDGFLHPADALLNSQKPLAVRMKAASGPNSLAIDGHIKRDNSTPIIDVDFKLNSDKPSELEQVIEHSLGSIDSIQASGHFQNRGFSSFHFSDLSITSGKNSVHGQIAVKTPKERPTLKADLSSEYLDIRNFISQNQAQQNNGDGSSSSQSGDQLFSNQPLKLKFLSNLNADIQLKAKKLLLPHLAMDAVAIKLSLKDGRLSLNPIEAKLAGGELAGELDVSIKNHVPMVVAKMRIKSLDLEPIMEELDVTGALKGNLGVDLNFRSRGASAADIMAGLNGQFTVVMRDGQIAAKYLENADRFEVDLADGFLKLFDSTEKKQDFAEINCFVSTFEVTNGIAASKVLVFDTERAGVLGDGTIDLKTESLNISLKPIKKGGIGVSGVGKLTVGLDIADSFKLGGTLSHPVVAVDKSEIAISTVLSLGKAIGGTLLFGPAGLAAALIGGNFGDDNPCISALKEAAAQKEGEPTAIGQSKKPND